MAGWLPLDPNHFGPLVQELQELEPQENVFNPPVNTWTPARRHALRDALGLDDSDRSDQIVGIIIAIANTCIQEHFAEYTTQALVARGWIVPAGNAWQRVMDLEDSLQALQEVVQTNHEQVTEQLQQILQKMVDAQGAAVKRHDPTH